jgi:thiamine pyrophosphokinase
MITVIVSGGTVDEAFASGFLDTIRPDHIIAADRGYHYLKEMGIVPDHIVGDFDSLPAGERLPDDPNIEIRRFRPEKDDTDTGIAAALAAGLKSDEVYFLGATGTRADHMIANIALLSVLAGRGITGHIVDAHNRISLLVRPCKDREEKKFRPDAQAGDRPGAFCTYDPDEKEAVRFVLKRPLQFGKYVSFAPYGGPVSGLTLTGFRYPLQERTLSPEEAQLLVSNEITEEEASVSFTNGALLMTESLD